MIWVAVALGCVIAGIVQAVTGFGSVVFMMMVFPFFFDMLDAPALALVVNWAMKLDAKKHAAADIA